MALAMLPASPIEQISVFSWRKKTCRLRTNGDVFRINIQLELWFEFVPVSGKEK